MTLAFHIYISQIRFCLQYHGYQVAYLYLFTNEVQICADFARR